MPTRLTILRDLLTSPSTTDAIQSHTGIPEAEIKKILHDEEIAGIVTSYPLKMLTVWKLTDRGIQTAIPLPKPPQEF